MPDPVAVNEMFGRIAGRYDFANHMLSGGLDFAWRRRLVREVVRTHPRDILDLATGSGDVAFALQRALPSQARITGMDFCPPMLEQAEAKRKSSAGQPGIRFALGNMLDLPVENASVDAITIAFGLRNAADRHRALQEMRRVLREPSGHLFVLEFSQPHRWFAPVYFLYLRHVLPWLAKWVTSDRSAYDYLGGSIADFPDRGGISAEIRAAGFNAVQAIPLTLGTVALHIARV